MAKKYIDAGRLKAEITKRKKSLRAGICGEAFTRKQKNEMLVALEELDRFNRIIDSLQQEQPEVDIDEEIDKFMFAPFQNFTRVSRHCLVDMGDGKEWVPVYDWKITTYKRADAHFLRKFARHFYELGRNARKK